ncbi:MAG: TldD/PmbA family protein [Nitrosopumilus sp.]
MSALEKAVNHSKKLGIDECEIICVKKKITTIRITDSKIVEVKENQDEDYGLRLILDKRITSIQTTKKDEIEKLIEKGGKTTSGVQSKDFWRGLPHKVKSKTLEGTYDEKLNNISSKKAIDMAQTMINSASGKKVNTITGSLNIVSEVFELLNSNDLHLKDKATYVSGIINAESEYGTLPVSGIGHNSNRTLKNFSPEQIGVEAKIMCLESLNPKKVELETCSVIFEPYSVGELLAFVASMNFSFKALSEKKSCFSNKFEKEIASKEFSLVDDPHIPEGIGTKSFDDEGIPTQRRKLVTNGIFTNTFSNIFDSHKEGKQSSGNASRPGSPMGRSAEPIPISAPHNLKIESGNISQEDMIKDTKRGLLIGRLWYTYAVNPIKGDFSCTARSGIKIIENGEIKGPGKSVRIIHSLPRMMKNISEIGNNQKNVIQWASLPSIVPSIKAEKITVRGI